MANIKKQLEKSCKRAKGSVTVEYAIALIIAAAITYPLIPLVKDVSVKVLQDTSDKVSPHFP